MKKMFPILLSGFLVFLTSCQFSSLKHGELINDGRYDFIAPKDTVTWLMEHAKAGDVDGIYQVFSPEAKDTSGNLREKIEEFIAFVDREMVSFEWYMGGPTSTKVRDGKFQQFRELEFFIQTEETRYHCMLRDVIKDGFDTNTEGFNSISVFPEGLLGECCYGTFTGDGLGVFLSYQEKSHEEETLKNLLDLASVKDSNGIYDLFSEHTKENTPNLLEQIQELIDFFDVPIRSWAFDNCVIEWIHLPETDEKLLRRMTIFSLYTDKETYNLRIRDLLDGSEEGENLGLYSIAISTDQFRGNNKDLGWRVPGIALYQLTIYADRESLDTNGGTVRFTTSIEATVTCEEKDIVPKQIDALIWEATLSSEYEGMNVFVATVDEERVTCTVYVGRQKG